MRALLLVLLVACAPVRPEAEGRSCVGHGRDDGRALWIHNGCSSTIVCDVGGDASWGPVEITPDGWWATPPTVGVPGNYEGECETASGLVAWDWPP